ncbi:MAG: hypothetical protein JWM04_1267, partial [Verrucomicrobiales bacterium]|nr:hypothetical protein [Verrucomicrobiales bacterium]
DLMQSKAIRREAFEESEKVFLRNLYICFAKGGAASMMAPESSKMMFQYLSCSGRELQVRSSLFYRSAPVIEMMKPLKDRAVADFQNHGGDKVVYESQTAYLGDPAYFDSFVGLYFGQVKVSVVRSEKDFIVLKWRGEVPWEWPSYSSIYKKYGRYHAQSFPLPNARSLLQGPKYLLLMDDGLGGYLAEIGLAKPFLVFAEWEEKVPLGR